MSFSFHIVEDCSGAQCCTLECKTEIIYSDPASGICCPYCEGTVCTLNKCIPGINVSHTARLLSLKIFAEPSVTRIVDTSGNNFYGRTLRKHFDPWTTCLYGVIKCRFRTLAAVSCLIVVIMEIFAVVIN